MGDKHSPLHRQSHEAEPLLSFLESFSASHGLATLARHDLATGSLKISPLAEISSDHKGRTRAGAGFEWSPNQRTIYLSLPGELGLSAALFYHELIHAYDSAYAQSGSRSLQMWSQCRLNLKQHFPDQDFSSDSRVLLQQVLQLAQGPRVQRIAPVISELERAVRFDQKRLFLTERRAHNETFAWIQALSADIPAFPEYLARHKSHGFLLDRNPDDHELIQAYELNSNYLRAA